MLDLEPLLQASIAIRIHVATALIAAVTGLLVLIARKGTRLHRCTGRGFVLAMMITAASSLFIHEIRLMGPFSPIHLLSVFVLVSLVQAIRAIRRGDLRAHRRGMINIYIGGIVIAGSFTFLPDRMMAKITYGGTAGEFPIVALFAVLIGLWLLALVRNFLKSS